VPKSRRDETILVRSKHYVPFQGAVFRGREYQFNSNWTETVSFAAHELVPLSCERGSLKHDQTLVEVIET